MDQEILHSSLEVLQRTRNLIEQGWCQGAVARNAAGKPVHPRDTDAVSWSLTGAFTIASMDIMATPVVLKTAYKAICQAACNGHLGKWNDLPHRTKENVLSVIDLAEAILKGVSNNAESSQGCGPRAQAAQA